MFLSGRTNAIEYMVQIFNAFRSTQRNNFTISSITMEEAQQTLLSMDRQSRPSTPGSSSSQLKWWASVLFNSFLILSGKSTAVILKRLYFDNGGNSIWIATLAQLAGFPALLPFYLISPSKTNHDHLLQPTTKPSALKLGIWYISLGLLIALNGYLYSIGILYLSLSTFILLNASTLAFTALFTFFLNKQKFTPYTINSLVVLTLSSVLLVQEPNANAAVSKEKHAIGILCAIFSSAAGGLMVPLMQYFREKVASGCRSRAMLDMVVCQLLVASCAVGVGVFASGDWRSLKGEMERYEKGEVSYLMTLVWTALGWAVFYVGRMKLLGEVSSLFCNVIATLGLPVVPMLSVFLFHDSMDCNKVVAMAMAIWGFVSYAYQCYLDNKGSAMQDEEAK